MNEYPNCTLNARNRRAEKRNTQTHIHIWECDRYKQRINIIWPKTLMTDLSTNFSSNRRKSRYVLYIFCKEFIIIIIHSSAQLFGSKFFFSVHRHKRTTLLVACIYIAYTGHEPNHNDVTSDARIHNTLTIEFMHWNVESVLDFHERIESMAAAAPQK